MRQHAKTINRLHFSDLDPLRFEDLCLNVISRLYDWKELNHFGRKGGDSGVDILGVENINLIEKKWVIQCKRYLKITTSDIKKIIDKIIDNQIIPDKLLVIISCDFSKRTYQFFKNYSSEKGIAESEIWSATILESKLYKDFKDLLFTYFGIRIELKSQENISKIRYSLRMEKKVQRELIDHKYLKELKDRTSLITDPSSKFISSKVIIRSIDDKTYPNTGTTPKGKISSWFTTFFYDTYHNGIEFWLDAVTSTFVIIDKEGFWEPLSDFYDSRKDNPKYEVIKAKMVGRIPYSNIIDIKKDGDEYDPYPHIYCKFDINEMPYEEIYFKSYGNPKERTYDIDFDRNMKTKFNKE